MCNTRLVRLVNTVWTQLANNSWIFYAPHPDVMTILCHGNSPVDIHLKGIGKLQLQPGCAGSAVVGKTSMQIMGDILSQIELKSVCCEELGVKVNLEQVPVEIAYRKTTAHLDDLRSASVSVSDLMERVNEQEWKNNHVFYRNTHSVLLTSIVSVILIYLLFKLYAHTSRWMPTCFGRKNVQATPTDMLHELGHVNQASTANNSCKSSEECLRVASPTPSSPVKVSHPQVATSHF